MTQESTPTGSSPVERVVSAHTPGPWEVTFDQTHYGTRTTVLGGSADNRLGLQRRMIVDVGGWAEWREAEANAKLIAAAPELLDVVKMIMCSDDVERCGGGCQKIVAAARDAIALAVGANA